jgi:hypothetical protein
MFFLIPTSVVRLPPHVFTFTILLCRGIFWFLHHVAFRTEELDIKATPHAWCRYGEKEPRTTRDERQE